MSNIPVENNRILNDDCLLNVFSFLTVPELNVAVTVSKQFQEIGQYTFRMSHQNIDLQERFRLMTLNQLEILFENFANYIVKLAVNMDIFSNFVRDREKRLVELLTMFFSTENSRLEALELLEFKKLELEDILTLLPIIKRLRSFKLTNCLLPVTLPSLFRKLHESNLREICISTCIPTGPLFLSIHHTIQPMPGIQKLELKRNENLCALYMLQDIQLNFPNLVDLSIHLELAGEHYIQQIAFSENVLKIAQLRELKRLSIDLEFKSMTPFLTKLVENESRIEELDINFAGMTPECIRLLSRLQTIKKLRLHGVSNLNRNGLQAIANCLLNLEELEGNVGMTIESLIKIVRSATKLNYLNICMNSGFIFNKRKYEEMLNLVKTQGRAKKLFIKIQNFGGRNVTMKERRVLKRGIACDHMHILRLPVNRNLFV